MKTQKELNELKTEYEALTTKLQELTEDELNMVTGGIQYPLSNISLGDCFTNGHMYLVSRGNFEIVNGNTIVDLDFYNGPISNDSYMYQSSLEVWNLFSSFSYSAELSNSSYIPR